MATYNNHNGESSPLPRKRSESSRGHKLSLEDVEAIIGRLQHGEKPTAISRDYPVSHVMISLIASGRKWSTITRKVQLPLQHNGIITFTWTYDPRTIVEKDRRFGQLLLDLLQRYPDE